MENKDGEQAVYYFFLIVHDVFMDNVKIERVTSRSTLVCIYANVDNIQKQIKIINGVKY